MSAKFELSINTGFALNRYSEPEEWLRIVGEDCQLRKAQMTADMLNPSIPYKIRRGQIEKIKQAAKIYNVEISSCFTGAFTRVNHLAHPEPEIQKYWVQWFKDFIDQSLELGSRRIGSHFGIFTAKDDNDPRRRSERRQQNIDNWHLIANYAKEKGIEFISWEPMSISREQGETISEAKKLQLDINRNSPLPFKICLDVDHGDLASKDPKDTDPYAWLFEFAKESPQIHLKQSQIDKGGHWPFTREYNRNGKIDPVKVINSLVAGGSSGAELIFEMSFRERQPADSNVIPALKESVAYWRNALDL